MPFSIALCNHTEDVVLVEQVLSEEDNTSRFLYLPQPTRADQTGGQHFHKSSVKKKKMHSLSLSHSLLLYLGSREKNNLNMVYPPQAKPAHPMHASSILNAE